MLHHLQIQNGSKGAENGRWVLEREVTNCSMRKGCDREKMEWKLLNAEHSYQTFKIYHIDKDLYGVNSA